MGQPTPPSQLTLALVCFCFAHKALRNSANIVGDKAELILKNAEAVLRKCVTYMPDSCATGQGAYKVMAHCIKPIILGRPAHWIPLLIKRAWDSLSSATRARALDRGSRPSATQEGSTRGEGSNVAQTGALPIAQG